MFRLRMSEHGPRTRSKRGRSSLTHFRGPRATTVAARGRFISRAISPGKHTHGNTFFKTSVHLYRTTKLQKEERNLGWISTTCSSCSQVAQIGSVTSVCKRETSAWNRCCHIRFRPRSYVEINKVCLRRQTVYSLVHKWKCVFYCSNYMC